MNNFKLFKMQEVNQATKEKLQSLEDNIGFIPNLYSAVAASESSLDAFVEMNNYFANSLFSQIEQQIILLATSTENGCGYCVAGHTTFSEMQGIPKVYVEAMRNNQRLPNAKLEALNQFTRSLVKNRGKVSNTLIKRFLAEGYKQSDVINLILGISIKTFSNLTSILMDIPLDAAFEQNQWSKPVNRIAA